MKIYDIDLTQEKRDIVIFPLGDIQYAGGHDWDQCSISRLEDYLDWSMIRFGDCKRIFLGTGDYIDIMSPSNRRLVRETYESTQAGLSIIARQWINELYEVLKPRLYGTQGILLHGHHWAPYTDMEGDSDLHLASLLGYEFCDTWKMLLKMKITPDKEVKIMASHGNRGGGNTPGAFFNMLEKQSSRYDGIDCFVQSHANKIGIVPVPRLREENGEWEDRHIHLIASGAFSKSVLADHESYAERADYPPLGIGGAAFRISRTLHGKVKFETTIRA